MNSLIDRARKLNKNNKKINGPVCLWMSRDQRASDNWALLFAQNMALKINHPLIVIFNLDLNFPNTNQRHFDFMLKGLRKTQKKLSSLNIPFYLLMGSPEKQITNFILKYKIGCLVTDFSPLNIKRLWQNQILKDFKIPFWEVDTHNIVPCWIVSQKQEYAAFTIRPKIHKLLSKYLTKFPKLKKQKIKWHYKQNKIYWGKILKSPKIDRTVKPILWLKPGEDEALKVLKIFVKNKLEKYAQFRNDLNENVQSNLSPYLHFGQISAQKIAIEIIKSTAMQKTKDAFLEELIVRKELADNFCYFNKNYDRVAGFPMWAQKSLAKHQKDTRKYLYSLDQLENAQTHDLLWNAAQIQMVNFGKMHGYLRMYWAKKILQWSLTPQTALKYAIFLNDKYNLDGRDPNAYAGISWSIGGIHDRPWPERKIFGYVRYMTFEGMKRKFNVSKFINSMI